MTADLFTFADRVRLALLGDATLAAYNGDRVVLVTDRRLDSKNLATLMQSTSRIVLVHNLDEDPMHEGHGGGPSGRDCSALKCMVSAVVRFRVGLDASKRELALVGSPGKPGVLDMQEDIFRVFWNGGLLNLLPDGGGNPLLWDLEIGAAAPEFIEEEKAIYLGSTRTLTGHRWRTY